MLVEINDQGKCSPKYITKYVHIIRYLSTYNIYVYLDIKNMYLYNKLTAKGLMQGTKL